MNGFLDRAREWMTPERSIAMQGLGMAFSQLGAGQPVNLSPAYEALNRQKEAAKLRKVMETPGIMDSFTPQQRAILAQMPEELAVRVLTESAFRPPEAPRAGIEVGNRIVDPVTGQVIYEAPAQADPGFRLTTPEEEAIYGAKGQVGPDGRFYPLGTGQETPAAFLALDKQARAGGLVPKSEGGDGKYEEFMLKSGEGGPPAAFVAIDMQARAGGLVPASEGGNGEYEKFMLTRGAGAAAEAAALGKGQAESALAAPGEQAIYSTLEMQVNDLLNDPYLPEMLGPLQGRLPNLSSDAARVQAKMDQISGGAFLQARQLLKGGGAITDFESQKAEKAFLRMQTAQSEADFRQAMTDFLDAAKAGLGKLPQSGAATPPPAPAGAAVSTPGAPVDDPLGLFK